MSDESLREHVEAEGGACSIVEATSWLLTHGYRVNQREVADLHDLFDGVIVGRSRVVTPNVAESIQDDLDQEGDDEAEESEDDWADEEEDEYDE